MNHLYMSTPKRPTPPMDVVHEESKPNAQGRQDSNGVDIDDAQIQEPKDDAFKKGAQPESEPKRRRKRA